NATRERSEKDQTPAQGRKDLRRDRPRPQPRRGTDRTGRTKVVPRHRQRSSATHLGAAMSDGARVLAFLVCEWQLLEVPRSSSVRLLRVARNSLGFDLPRRPFATGVHFPGKNEERVVVLTGGGEGEARPVRPALTLIEAKHQVPVRLGDLTEIPSLDEVEADRVRLDEVELWPQPTARDNPCVVRLRGGGYAHRLYATEEAGWLCSAWRVDEAYVFPTPADAAAWVADHARDGSAEIVFKAVAQA